MYLSGAQGRPGSVPRIARCAAAGRRERKFLLVGQTVVHEVLGDGVTAAVDTVHEPDHLVVLDFDGIRARTVRINQDERIGDVGRKLHSHFVVVRGAVPTDRDAVVRRVDGNVHGAAVDFIQRIHGVAVLHE